MSSFLKCKNYISNREKKELIELQDAIKFYDDILNKRKKGYLYCYENEYLIDILKDKKNKLIEEIKKREVNYENNKHIK